MKVRMRLTCILSTNNILSQYPNIFDDLLFSNVHYSIVNYFLSWITIAWKLERYILVSTGNTYSTDILKYFLEENSNIMF